MCVAQVKTLVKQGEMKYCSQLGAMQGPKNIPPMLQPVLGLKNDHIIKKYLTSML